MDIFNSPFTPYLNTNYVPTPLDRAHILSLLREPEAEVAQLNVEIARIQAELDVIQAEHDELEESIQAHYDLLSPFRRLPDDILREIFVWCLPTAHNALMSPSSPPLLLGRVCSRWRTLTFSTPRLWASLHLPLPVPPAQGGLTYGTYGLPTDLYAKLNREFEDRFSLLCVAITEWLTRSGTCLLSLSLNPLDMATSTGRYAEYIKTYFDILLSFSSRWRSVELTVPNGELSELLAGLQPTSLPKLEHVHLKFSRRANPAHNAKWLKSGLLTTRSLRILQLSLFPFRLSTVEADFSKLTHLILADIFHSPRNVQLASKFRIDEAYQLFMRCSNLVHCVIDIFDTPEGYNMLSDTLSLPHLESLTLIDGAQRLSTLLECLDLPSLRVVSYHTTFWPVTPPPPQAVPPAPQQIVPPSTLQFTHTGHVQMPPSPPSPPPIVRRSPLITLLSRTSGRVEELITDIQFFMLSDLIECFELVPQLKVFRNKKSRLGVSREQSRLRSGNRFPVKLGMGRNVLELFVPGSSLLRMLDTPPVVSAGHGSGPGFDFGDERVLCPHLHTVEMRDLLALGNADVLHFLYHKTKMYASYSARSSSSSSTSTDRPSNTIAPLKEASFTFTQPQENDLRASLGLKHLSLIYRTPVWDVEVPGGAAAGSGTGTGTAATNATGTGTGGQNSGSSSGSIGEITMKLAGADGSTLKLNLKYPEPRKVTSGNFNPANGLVKREDHGWGDGF